MNVLLSIILVMTPVLFPEKRGKKRIGLKPLSMFQALSSFIFVLGSYVHFATLYWSFAAIPILLVSFYWFLWIVLY